METLTKDQVVEKLGSMSVMEIISLTKELEQLWGVEAKPQAVSVLPTQQVDNKVAEQTEFTISLVSIPADKKISIVKLVREQIGLGLMESKNLVDALPKVLKESVSKEDADALKAKFTEAGAVVEVK